MAKQNEIAINTNVTSTKNPEGKKTSLRGIKLGQVQEILDELKQEKTIFSCDLNQLSKHFLFKTLPVNPFLIEFVELRNSYLENSESRKDEVPMNEAEFHKYVCDLYFTIVKSPKDELLNFYELAFTDIKKIENTLTEITKQESAIIKKNKSTEMQEKLPVLRHYQQHNLEAKEEIMIFLKDRIHNHALNQCYDHSLLPSFLQSFPYNYHWNAKAYTPHPPSDLDNKLKDLSIRQIHSLKKLYETDRSAFNKFLQQYITDNETVFSIRDLVNENHILDQHRNIINAALDSYSEGSKLMFANAAPTIIEGIFHELCINFGTDDNILLTEGFLQKLNRLKVFLNNDLEYEYYSFRFRIIRNKVAHGRMNDAHEEELSNLLLLDLHDACNLCFSNKKK